MNVEARTTILTLRTQLPPLHPTASLIHVNVAEQAAYRRRMVRPLQELTQRRCPRAELERK